MRTSEILGAGSILSGATLRDLIAAWRRWSGIGRLWCTRAHTLEGGFDNQCVDKLCCSIGSLIFDERMHDDFVVIWDWSAVVHARPYLWL